jgi:hypothetical protein
MHISQFTVFSRLHIMGRPPEWINRDLQPLTFHGNARRQHGDVWHCPLVVINWFTHGGRAKLKDFNWYRCGDNYFCIQILTRGVTRCGLSSPLSVTTNSRGPASVYVRVISRSGLNRLISSRIKSICPSFDGFFRRTMAMVSHHRPLDCPGLFAMFIFGKLFCS